MRAAIILVLSHFLLTTGFCLARPNDNAAIPAPDTVSPELGALISAGPAPWWNTHPETVADWQELRQTLAVQGKPRIEALKQKHGVAISPDQIGNVPVYIIKPPQISQEHASQTLLYLHGGGYVLGPGEAGLAEAIQMAGYDKIKVVAADYRLAPEFPFPAALEDAFAVYKGLLEQYQPGQIGIFGTSAGGGLSLALLAKIRLENLPMPGAVAAGTPWSDLSKTGDSYFANAGVDNVLVAYEGWLKDAAEAYANGHDLKNPLLSPIYGPVDDFPPILLTTGTRDLFLSNTIRMHQKLLASDIPARLMVFEGQSHAQYFMAPDAPETAAYFRELGKFFNEYLER